MKKLFITIGLVLLIFNSPTYAQKEVALEDLQIPSSPAFILLDVAPTSIERPTTTKAFSTSILNSIKENNGIPENYAVDFAPYWFFKHKNLNAMNYWGFEQKLLERVQKPFSQARFGSISFATIKSKMTSDTIGTPLNVNNIALGFRTTLFQLRSNNDIDELIKANNLHLTRLDELTVDPTISPSKLANLLEADTYLKNCNKRISEILNRKPTLALDFAGAGSWSYDNNYNSIKSNRVGAWLTLNYAQTLDKPMDINKNDYLNLYFTCRVLNDNNVLGNNGLVYRSTNLDVGGKIEFEFDKFSISYEYLYRNDLKSNIADNFRSSGLIKYRASDQLLVTATFGKNFGNTNNVITQIGLSLGLNSKSQQVNADKIQ